MAENFTTQWQRDLEHSPALTGAARARAYQGDSDALRLAEYVRQLDPRQVWGHINHLGKTDPQRLLAAVISLAAMVDPDQHEPGRPPQWTADIGGIPALHPDYDPNAPTSHKPTRPDPEEQATEVARLAEGGIDDIEIARRLGIALARVKRMRCAAGIHRRPGRTPRRAA